MFLLLAVAMVMCLASQSYAGCPAGFEEFNMDCYLIGQKVVASYNDAFYECFNKGGYLLNIIAEAENNYIVGKLQAQNNAGIIGYWTGGVFNGQSWIWQSTNQGSVVQTLMDPDGYTNWGPYQPMNFIGQQSKMAIMKNVVAAPYKWYSYNRWSAPAVRMSFVCEADYKLP